MKHISIASKSVVGSIHRLKGLTLARSCLTEETFLASTMSVKYETNFGKQLRRPELFVLTMNYLLFTFPSSAENGLKCSE